MKILYGLLAISLFAFCGCGRNRPIQSKGNSSYNPVVASDGASLTFSESSAAFGPVSIRNASPVLKTIRITNASAVNANGFTVGISGTNFQLPRNTCGDTVGIGTSCEITIAFRPTAVQAYQGSVSVVHSTASAAFFLSGSGIDDSVPHLSLSSESGGGDFGKIFSGGSAVQSFTLLNDGNGAAAGISVAIADAAGAASPAYSAIQSASGTPCGGSLAPGQSCSFAVRFAPILPPNYPSAVTFAASLRVAASAAEAVMPLTGSSIFPAMADMDLLQPTALAAVKRGATASMCVRIGNASSLAPLKILRALPMASGFAEDPAKSCPDPRCGSLADGMLAPGAACDYAIQFTSPGGGTFRTTFAVEYSDMIVTRKAANEVTASGLNRCDLRESQAFVLNPSGGTTGQNTLAFPNDARYFDVRVASLEVHDYAPTVLLEGIPVVDRATESEQPSHTIALDTPIALRAGANNFLTTLRVRSTTSAAPPSKIFFRGSYYTYGTCGSF